MMVLMQVNKHFLKRCLINPLLRYAHTENSSHVLYPLVSRRLLRVEGQEAAVFLQGLITNDMRHFEDGAHSMYSMFLNNKGRVLYDVLVHKHNNENSFLIECDKDIVNSLQKHLKIYKLKRLVEIEDMSKHYNVWTLIPLSNEQIEYEAHTNTEVNIYKDPRLSDLGFRVLSSISLEGPQVAERIGKNITVEKNEDDYTYLRYKLGVSEGAKDLTPATCFPLEVNCDYLHGVSFHKGCYIGQEVTARVHHTGVVRKRIMPLKFTEHVDKHLDIDTVISASDNPKSNLGKLKSYMHDYGLGLVRIKEAVDATRLSIGSYTAVAAKPSWWPMEAPKDKISFGKD